MLHVILDANLSLVGSHFCNLSGHIVLIVHHLRANVIPFLSLLKRCSWQLSYLWDYIFINLFPSFPFFFLPLHRNEMKKLTKEIVQNIVSWYSLCVLHLQSTDLSLSNLSQLFNTNVIKNLYGAYITTLQVLQTKGMVNVKQDGAYGDIIVMKARWWDQSCGAL